MNLRSLDLNLLVVFDAIYQEGSVTRAATKIFLSQSATSNALTRLRVQLKDELFLRGPQGLRPTPRAHELAPRISAILNDLKEALEPQEFDPATVERTVKIAAVDYFSVVVAPRLMDILMREAPRIQVQIVPAMRRVFEDLDNGDIDFAATALFGDVPDRLSHSRLIQDSYSCMTRRDHPLTRNKLSLPDYAKASHLLVSPKGDAHGFVDEELAKLGLSRYVNLVVNHFAAAPPIVAHSNLVLTAPTLLLEQLRTPELVIFECPVETPLAYRCLDLLWHDKLSRHPAQEWLRQVILRAAHSVAGT